MNLIESYAVYDDKILSDVEFSSAEVHETEFNDCVFKGCDFHETEFMACRFNDCEFHDCNLNMVTIKDCSFREVSFKDSKMVGINWLAADWPKLLSSSPINFQDCQLDYSTFIGLVLKKIKLKGCSLKDIEFSDANLLGADFRDSVLTASRFNNSDLSEARFEGATEYRIDITRNRVKKAKFSLPEAYSLLHSIEDIILIDG